jgi:hypothetical protein
MNINTKILNKTLATEFNNISKKIIDHNQVGFIPGMQGLFNIHKSINVIQHINRSKYKNPMIISMDTEKKIFDKIHHPFRIKTVKKQGTEGVYPNIIKVIYNKPIANIILNDSTKIRDETGCLIAPILFNIVLEFLLLEKKKLNSY